MSLFSQFAQSQNVTSNTSLLVAGAGGQGLDNVVIPSTVVSSLNITLYAAQGNFGGIGANYLKQQNPGVPGSGGNLLFLNSSAFPQNILPAGSDTITGPAQVQPGGFLQLTCDGISNWLAVAGASASGGGQQTAVVTIPTASVLTLHSVPFQLLPAPGAGKSIIIDQITAKLTFNSVAYTGANNVEIRYTDGAGVKLTADLTSAWLDSAATAFYSVMGAAALPTQNAIVVAVCPVADPAAGNSPVTLTIRYRILS